MQGSGFRVQGSGLWWRLRRKYIWGDAQRFAGGRFPVLNSPNIDREVANDKDFSATLSMTIRESLMPPSLLATSH